MILVTGGTGLVGSHLLYELANNNKSIKAIIRNRAKIDLVKKIFSYYSNDVDTLINRIDWVDADMLNLAELDDAFHDVTQVYNCAAVVAIGGKKGTELIDQNVTGTENIVNLCLEKGVKKLCHISSIAALGNSINGEMINEESKWINSKNHSAYSVSKYKSEMEVWRGVQEGLNAVIVNPSVILGPGIWNSGSGLLFTKAAKGMKFYTEGVTGYVDVRDVVDSMIQLMESDITNERFVINSENISYKDLFDQVAEVMNVKKPGIKATKGLLKTAYVLDSLASMLAIKKHEITKDVIRASNSRSNYTNEKIKNRINKNFIPVKESIDFIAKKFKEELTMN